MRQVIIAVSLVLASAFCDPAQVPGEPAAAAAQPLSGKLGSPEKVSDGVWVMRQPDRLWSAVIGNVGIIEQSDGVVLFDSGGTLADGRDVVTAVRTLTPKPVKAVIISHWHNDHPLGVGSIREAFPGVRIIATASAGEALKTRPGVGVGKVDEDLQAKRRANVAATAQLYAEAAEDAKQSPNMRQGYATEAPWVRERGERQLGNFVVLPTETFAGKLVLADPVRPIEVLHLGAGNTAGDAVAWLPRQRTIFAGDLVVAPTPYGFTVSVVPWLATLDRLEALDFDTLVPGHGKVQRDRSYLAALRWSMNDIREKTGILADSDLSEEAAYASFDKAPHAVRFGVTSDWDRYWLEQYWLEGMFRTALKEARGTPPEAG